MDWAKYPQIVKYRCHMVQVGKLRPQGSWNDHTRFRKILKLEEYCPFCEPCEEQEMYRTLSWLKKRTFIIEDLTAVTNGEDETNDPPDLSIGGADPVDVAEGEGEWEDTESGEGQPSPTPTAEVETGPIRNSNHGDEGKRDSEQTTGKGEQPREGGQANDNRPDPKLGCHNYGLTQASSHPTKP